jgi:DNA polymerase delta subunit 1
MKKEQLIEECKKLGLDDSGKVADLRERIKGARSESIEDLFKKYEQNTNKV